MTLTRKHLNLLMTVIGIMLFIYAYYISEQSERNKPDNTFAKSVIAHDSGVILESDALKAEGGSSQKMDPPISANSMTFAEYRELESWDRSHGYFSEDESRVYRSYELQTLKDLSAEGDVNAMMTLGRHYIVNDYNPIEAKNEYYKAAVFGATTALPHLASHVQSEMLRWEVDKNPEGRRAGILEMMAYYKVAALRGDPRASIPLINSLKNTYQRRYGEELVLTQPQLDLIDKRAKNIYAELLANRNKLGLGDFDNSTPISVQRDYSTK